MKREYINLIKELDKLLSGLRENWLQATGENRNNWFRKINSSIDERNRLMKLRDEA